MSLKIGSAVLQISLPDNRERARFLLQCVRETPRGMRLFTLLIAGAFVLVGLESVSALFAAPILSSLAGRNAFEGVPFIGAFVGLFEGFSAAERIQVIAAIMIIFALLRGVISAYVSIASANYGLMVQRAMIPKYFENAYGTKMSYIAEKNFGTLSNMIFGHTGRIAEVIRQINTIMVNVALIPVYVGLMVLLSLPATVGTVVFCLVGLFLAKILAGKQRQRGEELSIINQRYSNLASETLNYLKTIRLASAEKHKLGQFFSEMRSYLGYLERFNAVNAINGPLFNTAAAVAIGVLLFMGPYLFVGEAAIWLGQVLIFMMLLSRVVGPTSAIAQSMMVISQNAFAIDDFMRFTSECEANKEISGTKPFKQFNNAIVFENVSFFYGETGSASLGNGATKGSESDLENLEKRNAVLKDMSFEIRAREMTALVGKSGSGKTTIAEIMARLYVPQHGRILVDGVDLREIDLCQWRRKVGVVSQGTVLFNDSVASNLRLGAPDASDDDLIWAAKLAAADEFIDKLENGYETLLGPCGDTLSGGERQRLSIARAFLQRPDILILDEATNSLDTLTEKAVNDALSHFRGHVTIIVIAHRLSTVRHADKIVVLHDGDLKEQGSHDALVAQKGLYSQLLKLQEAEQLRQNLEQVVG